ncbi:hypothetical protein JCM4814A_84730 [Streptomyces phaeofaciens JCM 4814]|uniref:DUF4303 domain-containing protein n=1 Tax=Streptomyces phaeofaciens TaxID=68254 RepID=A0A918H742_9ACTN|nr:hypothetical protein [Streptomyces phaeofaciens]GGT43812.1 hypothetical protein GCM10010226_20310 [Streptomyces phaeofaciens]
MTFREHMARMTVRALAEFPEEATRGIYAVTFRIDSVDQDPRFPYLAIGYNTEAEVARLLAEPNPPEPWEARWSYAYFPPSGLEGIRIAGHHREHDPDGAALHRREATAQGLWYEDDDELPDAERDMRDEHLDEEFHALCVDLARHLHTGHHIAARLGRPVPVILYDMFRPDEMFTLTGEANPTDLVAEFLLTAE